MSMQAKWSKAIVAIPLEIFKFWSYSPSLLSSAELASASGAYVVLSSSLTFSSKHVRLGKIVVYYFSNGYYLTDDKVKCNLLLAPTINHI